MAADGRVLIPADASSLLHANQPPLRSSQMVVDTALESSAFESSALESSAAALSNAISTSIWIVDTVLERAEAELSNAVSTTGWEQGSGEWSAFKARQ